MSQNKNNKITEKERVGFKIKYVFLVALILLIFLSLLSGYHYNSWDITVIEGGNDGPIKNWIGPLGAHLSRILLYLFGVTSYFIAAFLIICGLRPIIIKIPTRRKGYIGALCVIIISVTILFAMWPEDFTSITEQLGIGHSGKPDSALSGGVIGQKLAGPPSNGIPAGIIRRFIGTVGTTVSALTFFIAGIVFIWFADWHHVFKNLYSKLQNKIDENKKTEKEKKLNPLNETKSDPQEQALFTAPEIFSGEEEDSQNIENKRPDKEKKESKEYHSEEESALQASDLNIKKHVEDKSSKSKSSSAAQTYSNKKYEFPPISLLSKSRESSGDDDQQYIDASRKLQETLDSFNVDGKVSGVITGPRVSRYEITLEPGVKVRKVTGIQDNIAMDLAAKSIRMLAPIPGKSAVGVEIANRKASSVSFRASLESTSWQNEKCEIPVVLGKDVSGKNIILDLVKAPHLLIAGATGSGKSVCMNTLIMSMLYKFSPSELSLIMVDPKVVEMETYKNLPHLITPVVNDAKKVPIALRWGVNEMEKRYQILADAGVKNLKSYNNRPKNSENQLDSDGNELPDKIPYTVIIIDELADVMMTDAAKDVEMSIARIAQKGRAAGIHIVIATQRPSTNIITGVIKANLPTRLAFKVGSQVDSRVIIDQNGSEKLLGQGDMLFIPPGTATLERIQGAWIPDSDIQKVVDFCSDQFEQQFDEEILKEENTEEDSESSSSTARPLSEGGFSPEIDNILSKYIKAGDDDLIKDALRIILTDRKVSTSYLQRRLKIGYNKAAEIIDQFEERKIVSPPLPGGQKREILITDDLEKRNI